MHTLPTAISILVHILQDRKTALMVAADKGHLKVVKALLHVGSDVSLKDKVYSVWGCVL